VDKMKYWETLWKSGDAPHLLINNEVIS